MHAKTQLFAALLLMTTATASFADSRTPLVDARQENQDARISQGVASGELTAREADRLDARQGHIENVEHRAKADGVVTRRERANLHHKQDRASRAIARQKHDRLNRR